MKKIVDEEKLKKLSLLLCADKHSYMRCFRRNVDMYVAEKDITLREIADDADMSIDTLKNFLYKDSDDCKLSTAVKLARALNISIDELIGAETIDTEIREVMAQSRNLPNNDRYLIKWFIHYLYEKNLNLEQNKRYVSIMIPELNNDGDVKLTSNYFKLDITEQKEPLRSKVFFGIRIISDYYMPHFYPDDIILIANDRNPKPNEACLLRVDNYLFIARRVIDNKEITYCSIRDEKHLFTKETISECIGYVADLVRNE